MWIASCSWEVLCVIAMVLMFYYLVTRKASNYFDSIYFSNFCDIRKFSLSFFYKGQFFLLFIRIFWLTFFSISPLLFIFFLLLFCVFFYSFLIFLVHYLFGCHYLVNRSGTCMLLLWQPCIHVYVKAWIMHSPCRIGLKWLLTVSRTSTTFHFLRNNFTYFCKFNLL